MPSRRVWETGASLFELAVAICVLAALAGVLLLRISAYQREAERVAVQQVVATLRAALAIRESALGQHGAKHLSEENPFEWLSEKPENYLGEYYSPDLEKIPVGNWVFDRRDKTLIYLLNSHKSFYFSASELLKFKVEFGQLPTQVAGLEKRPAEVSKGAVLVQVSDESGVE
ncbi:MAG: hypothetical protein ACXWC4_09465 [Telluria sp.]